MNDLLSYMNDWVNEAAYYLWESEGRAVGKDQEYWERAMARFVEAHL